jgi:hypothetical protein
LPSALASDATDEQKANYWMAQDNYWNSEAEARLSRYNYEKIELARLEMQYPNYQLSQAQSQEILNQRAKVAQLEAAYKEAQNKADTIEVSVGVGTTKDGDNERVERTYTITDDKGETVSTRYSEDNGGMSGAELRNKQKEDQQKALNASAGHVAAEAAREVEGMQASAEKDYAVGAAKSALDAYTAQYDRNLQKIDSDFAADRLEGNQDLLMASNEIASNAVKNSREANNILSQYNLGGSSLGGRLNQIASEAANNANQVASLTYNKKQQEAQANYGDARLQLEDQNAAQQNQFNQAQAQAQADYYQRMAAQAGKNYEQMSIYANPDYWKGTMFDSDGNRLNSFADMNSEQMQDYANQQSQKYTDYMNQYRSQQEQAAQSQTATKAEQYTSKYSMPAAKTYETGLASYTPVNSSTPVFGQTDITQPKLEREKEGEL